MSFSLFNTIDTIQNYIDNANIILPLALRIAIPPLDLNINYVSLPMGPTESPQSDMDPIMLPLPELALAPQNVMQFGDTNAVPDSVVLGIDLLVFFSLS